MATHGVVVSRANNATPAIGGLFAGKGFFLVQRMPMRSSYIDTVKANGGRVVRVELQADYIIADHLRNDCPPTSLSYTFIDAAVRGGALPDPNEHRAGPAPGVVREIGSTVVPQRNTRTPYTAQDDRDLWNWVQRCQKLGVQGVKGNEMYKQLEAVNPRHTFQSWRDRYVKKLMHNPPSGVAESPNAGTQTPTSPRRRLNLDGAADSGGKVKGAESGRRNGIGKSGAEGVGQPEGAGDDEAAEEEHEQGEEQDEDEEDVDDEDERHTLNTDFGMLMGNVEHILCVPNDSQDEMWEQLAVNEPHRTAEQWKSLYERKVLPAYKQEQKRKQEQRSKASPSKQPARPATPEQPMPEVELTTPEMVALKARKAKEKLEQERAAAVSTQKRKRQTLTPKVNTYGQKRAKANHSSIFAEDEAETGNGSRQQAAAEANSEPAETLTGQQPVIDSSRNMEEDDDAESLPLPGEEPLPTSEIHRAAKTQFMAEANQSDSEPVLPAAAPQPDVLKDTEMTLDGTKHTTVADTDAQELGESLPDIEAATEQQQQQGDEAASSGEVSTGKDAEAIAEVVPEKGLQLTEENLASQQAQHSAQLLRGADLPKDDDNQDQTRYADYLQGLLRANQREVTSADADIPGRLMDTPEEEGADAIELESDRELGPEDKADDTAQLAENGDSARVEGENGRAGNDNDISQGNGETLEIDLSLAEPDGGFQWSSQEKSQEQQLPNEHVWEQPLGQKSPSNNGEVPQSAEENFDEDDLDEAPPKAYTSTKGVQQPDSNLPLPADSDAGEADPELPEDPAQTPKSRVQPRTPKPTYSSRRARASASAKKSPPAEQPDAPPSETIQSFLDRLTAKGCAPAALHSALYRTSAQVRVAEMVAMYEKLGIALPGNIPQIWTAEDDAKVASTDASVLKELCARKGWEEYQFRATFLENWGAGQ
ncbi:hypothetical protein WHR41_00020 [Cladosporium halotolerans]|uniref:DNA-binding protein RAP1 n=1 Tax=Cladosporium halotolerans TaxID=1052096 RepID=A0AB34L295_9PEZI